MQVVPRRLAPPIGARPGSRRRSAASPSAATRLAAELITELLPGAAAGRRAAAELRAEDRRARRPTGTCTVGHGRTEVGVRLAARRGARRTSSWRAAPRLRGARRRWRRTPPAGARGRAAAVAACAPCAARAAVRWRCGTSRAPASTSGRACCCWRWRRRSTRRWSVGAALYDRLRDRAVPARSSERDAARAGARRRRRSRSAPRRTSRPRATVRIWRARLHVHARRRPAAGRGARILVEGDHGPLELLIEWVDRAQGRSAAAASLRRSRA